MEDLTLDRRSILKTTGALAGASALGLLGTGTLAGCTGTSGDGPRRGGAAGTAPARGGPGA